MKAIVQEIQLHGITREDVRLIRNELNQLTDGSLSYYPEKYPALIKLDRLLNGCFDAMHEGVHIISTKQ